MHVIKARKWTWAGHIARLQGNRWTCQVTDWRPMAGSRQRGRPSKRWSDEIDAFWRSVTWKQNARDRLSWKRNAEAFLQQADWTWLNVMMMMMMMRNNLQVINVSKSCLHCDCLSCEKFDQWVLQRAFWLKLLYNRYLFRRVSLSIKVVTKVTFIPNLGT